MLLRLSMKINVSVVSDFVCSIAINSAYSYALSIFGYLGSLTAICICNRPCYVFVSFHVWGCQSTICVVCLVVGGRGGNGVLCHSLGIWVIGVYVEGVCLMR